MYSSQWNDIMTGKVAYIKYQTASWAGAISESKMSFLDESILAQHSPAMTRRIAIKNWGAS